MREHAAALENAASQARDHFGQRAHESGATVAALSEQLRTVRDHAAARDRALAEAREAREQIEQDFVAARAQIEALRVAHGQELAELQRELTDLRSAGGERERELAPLRSQVSDLEKQLNASRRETAALRRRADRLGALTPAGPAAEAAQPVVAERRIGLVLLVLGAVATGALAYGFLHFVALGAIH